MTIAVCDVRRHSPAPAVVCMLPVRVLRPAVRGVGLEATPSVGAGTGSSSKSARVGARDGNALLRHRIAPGNPVQFF